MIALSITPSLATIRALMCADLGPGVFSNTSTKIAIERLAAEYHGWRFRPRRRRDSRGSARGSRRQMTAPPSQPRIDAPDPPAKTDDGTRNLGAG